MAKTFDTVTRLNAFYIGEKPLPLQVTFTDADGNALNLTNYSVDVVIDAVDNTVSGLGGGAASLSDAANGVAQYVWDANDFATEGLFRLQVWVGNGTYRLASKVFEFFVVDGTTAPNL